ncbi:MAG TPA: alpha/beta family hydrolase [Actinomycetes bacterium]|nr:alpha/beta family hydrolase [Actinomycetes bacterium]
MTSPRGALLLGHGAGGGVTARDLAYLAEELPRHEIAVALFEQPWRVAGRRVATPALTLDDAWLRAVGALPTLGFSDTPLFVGGRSTGARVACRTFAESGALGVIALGFPLHPPGREVSRAGELSGGQPTLVLQGSRDRFGDATQFVDLSTAVTVVSIPWADHEFAVPRAAPITQRECLELVAEHVSRRIDTLLMRESVAANGR